MKYLFSILSIGLFISCSTTKNTTLSAPKAPTIQTEKTTPLVNLPVDKKVPDSSIATTEEIKKNTLKKDLKKNQNPIENTTITDSLDIKSEMFDHQVWNDLLVKYVSDDGVVNYNGFRQEYSVLKKYLNTLTATVPNEQWDTSDKLAYWMNAYNAFTIKLILDHYPLKSIKDIKNPWDLRFFKLGTKWYTLNDIEHRILRKMKDPRIHFGINCASFSCPPLLNKAFTSQNVDQELDALAISFINDPKRNTIETSNIQISKIFSWFSKDFTTKGSLIDFLNTYSKTTINPSARKSFKKYNWSLNDK